MGLQHLFNQVNAIPIADSEQNDRQITRDDKAPKAGLTKLVAGNNAGRSTVQGIGINDRASQAAIDLSLRFGGVEVTQQFLTLEPCHFKCTLNEVPVTILLNQRQCGLAGVRDTGDDLYGRRFVG